MRNTAPIVRALDAERRVQVPPQVDHSERSEAQLHEGPSVGRKRGAKLRADGQEADRGNRIFPAN